MKTSVEINGYTISIEESEGVISVNAIKDDEVVEEFTIQIEEEGEGEFGQEETSDIQKFDQFGDEEEDFEGQSQFEDDDDDDDDDDESEESQDDEFEGQDEEEDEDEEERAPEGALESFQSFINKKRK